jgi:Fe2+ or Zn2+ uptake regulation protein
MSKQRNTEQRSLVLMELERTQDHPTAQILYQRIRKRLPAISFATVYRNLNLLRDQGRILELRCGRYSSHYDATAGNHYHFFCLSCQRVVDIDMEVLSGMEIKVQEMLDCSVYYHRIEFHGVCQSCKGKGGKRWENRLKGQRQKRTC